MESVSPLCFLQKVFWYPIRSPLLCLFTNFNSLAMSISLIYSFVLNIATAPKILATPHEIPRWDIKMEQQIISDACELLFKYEVRRLKGVEDDTVISNSRDMDRYKFHRPCTLVCRILVPSYVSQGHRMNVVNL
ncbi:hypothetical protein RND81_09G220200 [Saponaria officinalis]|uniref:Uncharacterized protein n=1 Tax=Saponaria officinalis TaxID=3572 RepID=A0AAW1IQR3_SAPOF